MALDYFVTNVPRNDSNFLCTPIFIVEAFLKIAEKLKFDVSDFGVNISKQRFADENKSELLQIILSSSSKEINSYLKLINVYREISK